MYKQGLVEWGKQLDTQTEDYEVIVGAYLPHSCDSWVIGGAEQIALLIKDLQTLLEGQLKDAK